MLHNDTMKLGQTGRAPDKGMPMLKPAHKATQGILAVCVTAAISIVRKPQPLPVSLTLVLINHKKTVCCAMTRGKDVNYCSAALTGFIIVTRCTTAVDLAEHDAQL